MCSIKVFKIVLVYRRALSVNPLKYKLIVSMVHQLLFFLSVSQDIYGFLTPDWRSSKRSLKLQVYFTPQCLFNTDPMEASMVYQLLIFGWQPKHSSVSFLTSDWRSWKEGRGQNCQDEITNSWIFHFMKITANIHNFWKK